MSCHACILCILVFITFSVDATNTVGIGRYVNDSSTPNAKMKVIYIDNLPRLLLFSIKEISKGDEVRYDYEAKGLWWRKFPRLRKPLHLSVSFWLIIK